MKLKYQYYPDDNLLIIQYEGVFDLSTFKSGLHSIFNSPNKLEIKRILQDLRLLKTSTKKVLFNQIYETRKDIPKINYKMAYIAEDPQIIANLHLYIDKLNNSNYKYFSTISAAIKHLNLNYNVSQIEKLLAEL